MDYKTGLAIETYEVSALIGRNVGYTDKLLSLDEIEKALKKATLEISNFIFSGTVTPTTIMAYGNGVNYKEQAVEISSSIYPRFPQEKDQFKKSFIDFIGRVAVLLKQERVAIRFTDESLMLETKYCKSPDLH
jgi:hypothetical protein